MPAIPTSVTVVKDATYPDHVATLSWIIPAGTLSVSVQRTWDGGMTWVRTQLGLVASYRWVDQIQDTQYGYRVRAEGVDGFSDWSAPEWLWTSPGAPSGLAVVRSSNVYVDDLLTFTCQNLSVTATAMRVQWSTDGITWMTVDTLAPARPSSSWQVVTPTDAVAYFRAANLGEGGLVSAWSNTVAIPASTSHLAPTGLIAADFDPAAESTWTWVVHPGADGSGQSRYEIQTRYYSGGTPTAWVSTGIRRATRRTGTKIWAAETFVTDRTYEWRVRTYAASTAVAPSSWSATATFETGTAPVPTVTAPVEGGTWTEVTPGADVAGTWFAITYMLYAADGRPIMSSTTPGWPPTLEDATGYRIGVRVKDITSPVWSVEIVRAFTVELARPAAPTVTTAWDANVASCTLTVTNPASTPPAIYNEVRRGGALIGRCPINGTFTDWLPPLGTLTYQVSAVSALPSRTTTSVTITPDPACTILITRGSQSLHFTGGLIDEQNSDGSLVLRQYDGRPDPVPSWDAGQNPARSLNFHAVLRPGVTSTLPEIKTFIDVKDVCCWRDATGRRLFGVLTEAAESVSWVYASDVTLAFRVTEGPEL